MLSRSLKRKFAAAIRRMLRPIVRQLIAYGVSYPAFDQMVREVFVEVAEKEFALPFKRQTDSRLALVTGIHRKEVAQLRKKGVAEGGLRDIEDTVVTHVIGRWMAGPPYATPDGVPRRLPYDAREGGTPSFVGLVRELGVDIPPRAVLDELLRVGSAELRPEGDVVLREQGHIARGDVEGKLALIGSDPGELFSTIVHNIDAPDTPWFQRKVVYDNVGSEALQQLEGEARRLGEEFIRRANALLSSYDRDRRPDSPGGKRCRVALGAYYFEEETEPGEEAGSEGRKPPGRIRRPR